MSKGRLASVHSHVTCHTRAPAQPGESHWGQVLGLKRVKLKRWDRGCREAAGRQTLPGACSPSTKVTALLGKGQPGDQMGPRGRGPRSGLRSLGEVVAGWPWTPCVGRTTARAALKRKQMKTKTKQEKVKEREDTEIYSYLILKGTGNKYISNDAELEVADGREARGPLFSLKSFLRMLSTGTNYIER